VLVLSILSIPQRAYRPGRRCEHANPDTRPLLLPAEIACNPTVAGGVYPPAAAHSVCRGVGQDIMVGRAGPPCIHYRLGRGVTTANHLTDVVSGPAGVGHTRPGGGAVRSIVLAKPRGAYIVRVPARGGSQRGVNAEGPEAKGGPALVYQVNRLLFPLRSRGIGRGRVRRGGWNFTV
jgi:hypothetical protein